MGELFSSLNKDLRNVIANELAEELLYLSDNIMWSKSVLDKVTRKISVQISQIMEQYFDNARALSQEAVI